jgi:hypothetical protein
LTRDTHRGPMQDPMPSGLTRCQRLMLRAWAINMTLAFRLGSWRRLGFSYSSTERLRALAAPLSAGALAVWVLASVALFFLMEMPVLVLALTQLQALPWAAVLGLIILATFAILPLALGAATGSVDFLFRIPALEEHAQDAELYGKVRSQLLMVAIVAIVCAIVIAYLQATWG